jgi:glycosyltransferase involved in cell wall biosynthesis
VTVLVLGTSYFEPASWAAVLRRRQGAACRAVEAPSTLTPRPMRLARTLLIRSMLRRLDALVGVTPATVQLYRGTYGFRGPTCWCPYHRDLRPFAANPAKSPRAGFRFGVLGRLVRGKAVDTAVRAMTAVPAPASLVVIGDGPERQALERWRDVAPGAVQFTGAVPYSEVSAHLAGVPPSSSLRGTTASA